MVEFAKTLNSAATNAATFDVDAGIVKTIDKLIEVFQDVDLEGNFANLFGDLEAVGSKTLSDLEFSILTIANELSSMSVLAESAATDPVPPLTDPPVPEPTFATPIGVGVGGDGELIGVAGDDTLQFIHIDFDDWNPLLDLDSPNNVLDGFDPSGIFPGTPDLPNPGNGLDFEPIDLVLVAEIGGGAGVFQYASDSGFDGTDTDGDGVVDDFGTDTVTTYNFGNVTADVDTDGDGIVDLFDVTEDLLVQIPDGTFFVATQQGDELELVFAGGISPALPVLEFGSTTYELASFGYETQGVPGLIAQYGANFATSDPVLSNASASLGGIQPPPDPPDPPEPVPPSPVPTPIGVGVSGDGELSGVAGDDTLQFVHVDFDDWNPLLDLESPNNVLDVFDPPGIFPGTPDLANPGNGLDFESIDLVLLAEIGGGAGVFQYASDSGFDGTDTDGDGVVDDFGTDSVTTYNFGTITADVDTDGDGALDLFDVTDDLSIQIPDGTLFVATQSGDELELVFAGEGPGGLPVLEFASTTFSLATFGYENQGVPGLVAQYGVNFSTAVPVLSNPSIVIDGAPIV